VTIPRIDFREPKFLVRAGLGLLLLANLVAATMAFHVIGESPTDLETQLSSDRAALANAQVRLKKSKALIANMQVSRDQGAKFVESYMTNRKKYVSTTDTEINKLAEAAGMKVGDLNYSLLDPIEGSSDLDMLTITANFQGGYANLVKFVNMLDRSPRFLLIAGLQVAPQPKGDVLDATVTLYTFVREQNGGAL
jgi:hypothetical protein